MSEPLSPPAPVAPEKPGGFLQNLVDMYFAPREAFTRIVRDGSWILPTLGFLALTLGFVLYWGARMDPTEFAKVQLQETAFWDRIPPEQRAQVIEQTAGRMKYVWINGLVGGLLGVLVVAAVLWLVYRFFYASEVTFRQSLAITSWTYSRARRHFHAVIHAQPPYMTYLSHVPRYQDETYLNTHPLRWQPETIVNLPEGIGFVPFRIPSSPELMAGTVESLRKHRIIIWAKHGVMSRSDISVKRAADRVEYAETAAKYEYINLSAGEIGEGLSADEIRGICRTFNVKQNIF